MADEDKDKAEKIAAAKKRVGCDKVPSRPLTVANVKITVRTTEEGERQEDCEQKEECETGSRQD